MSLTRSIAVTAILLTSVSCGAIRDLSREVAGQASETNVSFRLDHNLLWLENMTIEGRPGHFVASASLRRTLLDDAFSEAMGASVRVTIRGAHGVRLEPDRHPLAGGIDAMIGYDVLGPVTLIDYHNQTIARRNRADLSDADYSHQYAGQPSVRITIDGREFAALIDTANPDTIHVPATWMERDENLIGSRATASVSIGEIDLGRQDFLLVERGPVRLGNRILSRFLVAIDYPARTVALWDRSPS